VYSKKIVLVNDLEFRNKKIAIIHHNDGDGICSAAIFALMLKKLGNFPALIIAPEHVELDDTIKREIKESKAEAVVVLDIPIERVHELGLPMFVMDHHPYTGKLDLNAEINHNTENCCAYLTFEYCRKIAEIEELAWISAVGCLSDKDETGFNKILPFVERGLDREVMQKMMGFISSAKIFGRDGIACGVNALIEAASMGIPTAVLGSTPNAQRLQWLRNLSRKERDYWLLFHKDFAKINEKTIFYKIQSVLPIQSYLAGTLSNFYPNHVCLVTNKNYADVFMTIEARTKIRKIDLGSVFREIATKLGGNGGGLAYAAGAKIPVEKEQEFLKLFESRL